MNDSPNYYPTIWTSEDGLTTIVITKIDLYSWQEGGCLSTTGMRYSDNLTLLVNGGKWVLNGSDAKSLWTFLEARRLIGALG